MEFVTFIFIGIGLIIRNLGLSPILFYDWDEGMYAQIAREILKNKTLFTTFNGHVWLDKPPLVHSLIALVFSIFGQSEFWARMIMVITSLLLLVLVYLLSKKIVKSAPLLPVLILAASPIFLERATMLNSDIFVAVAWLGYFLFWDNYWVKLFFLTLGVWSKSVLGFYPLLIDIFYLSLKWLIFPKKRNLDLKKILKGTFLILLPSLWYFAGIIKYGRFFIENHFLSQVLKRLYVPIELHFGNKFFYFEYLWNNLGIINLLFLAAYVLIAFNLIKSWRREGVEGVQQSTLIFLSPLPFLALLTLMKTKITWYVIIFLPFLTLLLPYLCSKVKAVFKIGITIIVVVYFLINFIPQTFLLKIQYELPPKLALAKCLSKIKGDKIAFLVDLEERKVRNFLEAAHYDTTSSFFYGGSPSFVYYVQKKVDYFYDPVAFSQQKNNYPLIVVSKNDWDKKNVIICKSDNWLGLVK